MSSLMIAPWSRFAMAFVLIAAFAVISRPSDATMMSPFGQEVLDLNAQDLEFLKRSVFEVLETNVVGAVSSWKNQQTGHSGAVALIRSFDRKGQRCGAVEHTLTAGGRARFVLPFCKFEDGMWKIVF